MKVAKKILVSILICTILLGSVSAFCVDATVYGVEDGAGEIQPRVEETQWYYKTVDGVVYMRLWSITYGKWLTDWMPA